MEKKKRIILTIIVVSTVLMLVGTSLAYYASSVLGTGNSNNNKLSASAVKLGSIYYDGVTTFTSTNMYPGQKFVQEFIVGPQGSEGVGIYGINLEASVPEAFGSDVKISLYKTTDKTNNNVVRTEGTLIQNGNQYYQEDTITVNGSPELLYGPEVLTSTSLLELESVQFDVTTLEHTTYYLVYEYANNGNQDAQQGLSFSGKITVNLTSLSEDVFDPAKPMLFADYIDKLAENGSTELAYGDVGDNAVRYYGANPNNYVDIGDKYSSNIYRGYLNTQIFHSISEVSETYKAFDSLEECQNDPDYNWNCTYFAQPYKAYLNQELVTSSKEFQEYYCEDSEYNYNCTYTRTIYVVHGYYLSSDGVPEGDPVEYIGEDAMGECQALGDKMCMEMEVRNMYTGYYNTVGNNVYKIVALRQLFF